MTSMSQLDSVLGSFDFVQTASILDQNLAAGFVEIEIGDGIPVSQALELLSKEGFQAQPNYVYHPIEESTFTDEPLDGFLESDTQRPDNDLDVMASFGEAELRTQMSETAKTNDPYANQQWALDSLNVYQAWGIVKCKEDKAGSPKVSVAVVDTGCYIAHEDLVGNVRATYNSATMQPGNDQVFDSIGHGTHVAGIVSADANNGKGVAGTSYDAGLVVIKASLGETKDFTTETLARAYAWLLATDGSQTNAQRHNVRVVNMSVGGKGVVAQDDILYRNITKAKNEGILTICAAGNSEAGAVPPYDCIPADYEDCFAVINLAQTANPQFNDSSGTFHVERSNTSNFNVASGELNRSKSISAPGTAIYSTLKNGSVPYGSMSGTSMASPAVAGIAALLFAYDQNLSADDVRTTLEQTATDIGNDGWDSETGYGEVDAYHALQVVSAEIAIKDVLEGATVPLMLRGADGINTDASEWVWKSSDPEVFVVDSNAGQLEATGSGIALLTATHKRIAGRTISQTIRVGIVEPEENSSRTIDLAGIGFPASLSKTYTGAAIIPNEITELLSQKGLKQGVDYTLNCSNNVNVGTATITIKAVTGGAASGSRTTTFKITPKSLSDADVKAEITQPTVLYHPAYEGSPYTPPVAVTYNGKVLTVNQDYTVSCDSSQAGNAWVNIKAKNANYTGEKRIRFTIKPRSLQSQGISVSNIESTKTYNGSVQKQEKLLVKYDGRTLKKDKDYIVSYRNVKTQAIVDPREVGEYQIVIKGINNYADTITRNYAIKPTSNGNNPGGSSSNKPNNSGSSSGSNNSGSGSAVVPAPPKAPAVTGSWKKSGGKWWFAYDAKSKAAQKKPWPVNEWVSIKGKRYHFNGSGYMNVKWFKSGNYWYYLGADGAMKTGWQKTGGKWYFLAGNGVMQTGKKSIAGKNYYLDPSSGAMKTGWSKQGAAWYHYGSSGAMSKGWAKVGKRWYYLNPSDGVMKTHWLTTGGQRYFLHPSSGEMLVGWVQIDGVWYFFNKSGALQKNKWIGNYYVESNGVMATNKWIGKYHVNASGKWDKTR